MGPRQFALTRLSSVLVFWHLSALTWHAEMLTLAWIDSEESDLSSPTQPFRFISSNWAVSNQTTLLSPLIWTSSMNHTLYDDDKMKSQSPPPLYNNKNKPGPTAKLHKGQYLQYKLHYNTSFKNMRLISKNIQELSTKMKIKFFSKLGFYGIMENKTLHDSLFLRHPFLLAPVVPSWRV